MVPCWSFCSQGLRETWNALTCLRKGGSGTVFIFRQTLTLLLCMPTSQAVHSIKKNILNSGEAWLCYEFDSWRRIRTRKQERIVKSCFLFHFYIFLLAILSLRSEEYFRPYHIHCFFFLCLWLANKKSRTIPILECSNI